MYADKTACIHRLVTGSEGAFFLSRPRRFGKSLLCSTLGAVFEGRRELFKGLAIDSLEWGWKKHPVIRIDLNPGDYSEGTSTLKETIRDALEDSATTLGLSLRGEAPSSQFINLIRDAHQKCGERVVVVIDEYDKPLLSTIDMESIVYCFEFKLDKSAGEALAQIDTKEYLLPWAGNGKRLFKVGVDFDQRKRNIGEWKAVEASA